MSESWWNIGYRNDMGMPEGHDFRLHANDTNHIIGHNEHGQPVHWWHDHEWTPSRWTTWRSIDEEIANAARRGARFVYLNVERNVPYDRRGESPMPYRTEENRLLFSLAEARKLRDTIRESKGRSAASKRAWKNRRFWSEDNKRKYL